MIQQNFSIRDAYLYLAKDRKTISSHIKSRLGISNFTFSTKSASHLGVPKGTFDPRYASIDWVMPTTISYHALQRSCHGKQSLETFAKVAAPLLSTPFFLDSDLIQSLWERSRCFRLFLNLNLVVSDWHDRAQIVRFGYCSVFYIAFIELGVLPSQAREMAEQAALLMIYPNHQHFKAEFDQFGIETLHSECGHPVRDLLMRNTMIPGTEAWCVECLAGITVKSEIKGQKHHSRRYNLSIDSIGILWGDKRLNDFVTALILHATKNEYYATKLESGLPPLLTKSLQGVFTPLTSVLDVPHLGIADAQYLKHEVYWHMLPVEIKPTNQMQDYLLTFKCFGFFNPLQ